MSQQPLSQEHSAGGIVYKIDNDGIKIAVIYREFHQDWTLPKGHLEEGESPEQAAIREVKEEVGLDTNIIKHIGYSIYRFTDRKKQELIQKKVDYFLMELVKDNNQIQESEVDKLEWLPFMKAIDRLSFNRDQDLVKQCIAEISQLTKPEEKAAS